MFSFARTVSGKKREKERERERERERELSWLTNKQRTSKPPLTQRISSRDSIRIIESMYESLTFILPPLFLLHTHDVVFLQKQDIYINIY